MVTDFETWLQVTFKHDNHSKYTHYYEEWRSNLLESQVNGFMEQFNRIKRRFSTK